MFLKLVKAGTPSGGGVRPAGVRRAIKVQLRSHAPERRSIFVDSTAALQVQRSPA